MLRMSMLVITLRGRTTNQQRAIIRCNAMNVNILYFLRIHKGCRRQRLWPFSKVRLTGIQQRAASPIYFL